MALIKAGLTNAQLAREYAAFVDQFPERAADPLELRARFGAPRSNNRDEGLAEYSFLDADPYSAQALRSYADFGRAQYVDEERRQYARFGDEQPSWVYVKLPTGITREERAERLPASASQQFPRVGDSLMLSVPGGRGETVEAHVVRVLSSKRATALIELDVAVTATGASAALNDPEMRVRLEAAAERVVRRLERQPPAAPTFNRRNKDPDAPKNKKRKRKDGSMSISVARAAPRAPQPRRAEEW